MKAATLRTFQLVHTWTGVMAGFFLFVAFYAGALTVFHGDIATWQHPPWRSAASPVESRQSLIDRFLAVHPEARADFGLVLPPPGTAQPPYMYWPADGEEHFATADALERDTDAPTAGSLADFIYALHDSLGIPVVGLYLMGLVSMLYGLALVSGIVIHLPGLVKGLFALRPGHNLKRLWLDAHNVIGVLSLPFHMIFAVTGALMCLFTLVLALLNTVAFEGALPTMFAQAIATAPPREAAGEAAPMLPVDALLTRARAHALATGVDEFEPDYVHFSNYGDRHAVVEVRGLSQRTLATYGTVALDGQSGRVLQVHVGPAYSANGSINSSMYALHFGSFGGRAVQWMYFGLGLAGAFLFYSGNLLWVESRRKRRHRDQPRRTLWMGRATVGVCLGSCLGISAAFLATLLGEGRAWPLDTLQRAAAYGMFAVSCTYVSIRPLATAVRHLLLACSAMTALPALLDLARNAGPWVRNPWTGAHGAVLGVDLTGLLLALVFLWLARASARRAREGDPNSIWAGCETPDTAQHPSVHG
ncbi:PepSY-associated TM helix domain-containing protein [Dyella sp.]|jgi:uncharacterized iron-regulated membrane protein|uniref:PepSY-associated TM helix domain-containing protein n=1 Tax=Dyella sp. TaxID=1869338 RepID=UPI002D76641E|nr:PepSY-associated TM helix domain-containing protein [Dyella sp.]HET6433671.1 PepSY-associated TM helix domain-containing protein [Dyella sp.]